MRKLRKNPYIPHLAEFFFEPKPDWSKFEANKMYLNKNFEDKIHYVDCIEGMQQMEPESIDLIFADPPFGISFSGKESFYNRDADLVIDGYHEIEQDYHEFTLNWIHELPRIMKQSASAYIVSGYTNLKDVLIALDNSNLILLNHIIWQYQFAVFTKKKYASSHFHLLFVVKDPCKYYFHRILHYTPDIWDIPRTFKPNKKKNGTKLPEALVQRCIDFSSKPGDVIFDPFMGNGTSAVVAKKNFRHYYGFEKNIKLEEIINQNLEQVQIGEDYIMYKDRLVPKAILATQDNTYKRAYQEYLKHTN